MALVLKISSLFLLTVAPAAFATDINISYQGQHISDRRMLLLDVHRTQQAVGRYLVEHLGCSQVKLCMNNFVPYVSHFFRTEPGTMTLGLTATCSGTFMGFRFDMNPADDWEDYTDALVGYTQDGHWVEVDIVARPVGEDTRQASSIISVNGCDSSPIDNQLPFAIITNPRSLRHFSNQP